MPTEKVNRRTVQEKGAKALCADLGEIANELQDKNFPVETRETLYDPYLAVIRAGYELTGAEIEWVPPKEDPTAGEMAESINNLREYIRSEGRLPDTTTEDLKTFRDEIVDFVHKLEQASTLDLAFKEEKKKKVHGRWVQSVGVRDDVDPKDLDGDDGREIFAGPRARIELERLPREARQCDDYDVPLFLGTGVRKGKDATIPKESLYRHTITIGVTGYGKSTLLTNNQKQLIEAGHGLCFIDPKGEDSKRIAELVPEDRKDDIIWIEPGASGEKISGFNFINVGLPPDHPQIETAVSALVDDLKKMLGAGDYWGPRMDRIAGNLIRAMNIYNRNNPERPDLNLADLYYVLQDERSRREFMVLVKAEGIDFVEDYTEKIGEMEDDKLEPILGRMQPWIESPIARRMICFRESEINIPEAVSEGKIIIVRMGSEAKDLKRMLGMAVVRRIWATIRSRANMQQEQREPFYLFVDEAHNIALADDTFPTMLAEARSFRLSINLATQYLSQLPQNVVEAICVNCDTIMSFNPGSPKEAHQIAPQLDMEPQSLLNEGRFHIWMRMTDVESGELTDPFKVYCHPPFPPYRTEDKAEKIIENSLSKYGREKISPEERKDRLQFYKGQGQLETGVGQKLLLAEQDPDFPEEAIEGMIEEAIRKRRRLLQNPHMDQAGYEDDEEIEEKDDDELDKTDQRILESVYAAAIKDGRKANQPVPVEMVEDEIEVRVDDMGYGADIANAIEALSQFVELTTTEGEESVRLTNDGRSVVFGSTGESVTGGGLAHRRLLRESFEVFTRLGYHMSLPTQEGDELPDGLAESPYDPSDIDPSGKSVDELQEELESREQTLQENYPHIAALSNGDTLRIEAETSTHFRPSHTLQNLRKSVNRGEKTVFFCKDGYFDDKVPDNAENPTIYWGPYIERIMYDQEYDSSTGRNVPKYGEDNLIIAEKRRNGDVYMYNKDGDYEVTTNGGEYKALRPASDSAKTVWKETLDGEVLAMYPESSDQDDRIFARFNDQEHAESGDPSAVPAYYYYDRGEEEYIVKQGGDERKYGSKSELEDDWETFNPAFLPRCELDHQPSEEDFFVVILPNAENPEYDQPLLMDQGEVYPLYDHLDVDVPDHAYITEEQKQDDPLQSDTADAREVDEPQPEEDTPTDEETDSTPDQEKQTKEDRGDKQRDPEPTDEEEQPGEGNTEPNTENSAISPGANYPFRNVETEDQLPETCPQCGDPSSEILIQQDRLYAGPITTLGNFPSVAGELTAKGILDIESEPPVITETIETTVVGCSTCTFGVPVYFPDQDQRDQTADDNPTKGASTENQEPPAQEETLEESSEMADSGEEDSHKTYTDFL